MLTNYNVVNVILSIQASVKTQTIHIEQHTLDSFEKKIRNRNMLKAKQFSYIFFCLAWLHIAAISWLEKS